jgi:hypothetical protein
MATIDDFIKHAQKSWKMRNMKASRRPLFLDGDRLVFKKVDDRTALLDALVVTGGEVVSVLPERILCRLHRGGLTAIAYGRRMQFAVAAPTPQGPWTLSYEADYLEGVVNHPDEGGDGDPDPQLP